jgi:hypothetical protein
MVAGLRYALEIAAFEGTAVGDEAQLTRVRGEAFEDATKTGVTAGLSTAGYIDVRPRIGGKERDDTVERLFFHFALPFALGNAVQAAATSVVTAVRGEQHDVRGEGIIKGGHSRRMAAEALNLFSIERIEVPSKRRCAAHRRPLEVFEIRCISRSRLPWVSPARA